ncbi:hypothetical protein AOL_s00088g29 [Orbilia oligospora ATCC 24927]|uniref:Uncharacterized protein n=2 Tax=Orbilia oligospora TaxID=2813651 RepID=G1XHR6_ARTOA|nr:hypothetical protein AOL_s00088g29 [Orbilia oligospora ATCC 24927]EGX47314.1 hypothetical protein AOL_s00088g29 [Orbilia oligospora ATCC 24927]KAF3270577.1 hypothetical protein TWF970_010780 [Orbilia oligospora]
MDFPSSYPKSSAALFGLEHAIGGLIREHGSNEGFTPLQTTHPDLDTALSSAIKKVTELYQTAGKLKVGQIVLERRTNRLENHLAPVAALENHYDNANSVRRNGNAKLESATIQAITRARSSDQGIVYEYPTYFPETIRDFLTMNAEQIIYLLDFYTIRVVKPLRQLPGLSDTTQHTTVEYTPTDVQSNRYRCLSELAGLINLKLHKIESEKLKELKASIITSG